MNKIDIAFILFMVVIVTAIFFVTGCDMKNNHVEYMKEPIHHTPHIKEK